MDTLFFKDWFEYEIFVESCIVFTVDDDRFIYGTNIKFAVSQVIYQTEKMFRHINKINESREHQHSTQASKTIAYV